MFAKDFHLDCPAARLIAAIAILGTLSGCQAIVSSPPQAHVRIINPTPDAPPLDLYHVPNATYSLAILPAGTLPASTAIATYTGPQVTYTAGAARTIILIDPPLVATPGVKVITANDFDPPGEVD